MPISFFCKISGDFPFKFEFSIEYISILSFLCARIDAPYNFYLPRMYYIRRWTVNKEHQP